MKLLFDHNLSPRLVDLLSDLYPQSSHVATIGLETASDHDVWTYAREHGFNIVTKDSDFNDLTVLRGYPPKIFWLRMGNCTTRKVEQTLRAAHPVALEFLVAEDAGILELT